MKIAVGGKGGSGKTTVAGTLARVLAERGQQVVAMDDDSNPNLAMTLGVPRDQAASLPGMEAGLEHLSRGTARHVDNLLLIAEPYFKLAFARSEDRTRALHAGFLVHASKPVEPSELVATVAGRTGAQVRE
jgi:CO dehydrogenase nickel-insertion accessory protein CooC1